MNWPALLIAVTTTIAISTGCVRIVRQSASDSGGGRMPSGSVRHTPTAAASDRPATPTKDQRHPQVSPMKAASGMPSTEATDQPRKMKVMARPRCCGAASALMADTACGVKAAAPSVVRQRSGSSAA